MDYHDEHYTREHLLAERDQVTAALEACRQQARTDTSHATRQQIKLYKEHLEHIDRQLALLPEAAEYQPLF